MKDMDDRLSGRMDAMEDKIRLTFKTMLEEQSGNIRRMVGTVGSNVESLGSEIRSDMGQLNASMGQLKDDMASFSVKFDAVNRQVSTLNKRLTEVEKSTIDAKSMVVKELSDIEAKRLNIVLFGVPEPTGTAQRDKDAQVVDSILEVVAEKKVKFEIKNRMGAKEDGKVRPIQVRLKEGSDKELILSGSNKLKGHQHYKRIYIQPDRTASQRELMKKQEDELREEAARKNSLLKNGEGWEWQIRGKGLQRHLVKIYNRHTHPATAI